MGDVTRSMGVERSDVYSRLSDGLQPAHHGIDDYYV